MHTGQRQLSAAALSILHSFHALPHQPNFTAIPEKAAAEKVLCSEVNRR
jgi:hypothetical protein